jgi:hypothetical protein
MGRAFDFDIFNLILGVGRQDDTARKMRASCERLDGATRGCLDPSVFFRSLF